MVKTANAERTDRRPPEPDEAGGTSDLPEAGAESSGATKWGPALPVTWRTAFMSVRGLA